MTELEKAMNAGEFSAEPEQTAVLTTAQVISINGTLGVQLEAAVHSYNALPKLAGEDVYAELNRQGRL